MENYKNLKIVEEVVGDAGIALTNNFKYIADELEYIENNLGNVSEEIATLSNELGEFPSWEEGDNWEEIRSAFGYWAGKANATSSSNIVKLGALAYKELTLSPTIDDTNVPVRVLVDDEDIAVRSSDGENIHFRDANGNTLTHSRLRYSIVDDRAIGEYWVILPSVSNTSNTTFRIYYGDGKDTSKDFETLFPNAVNSNVDFSDGTTGYDYSTLADPPVTQDGFILQSVSGSAHVVGWDSLEDDKTYTQITRYSHVNEQVPYWFPTSIYSDLLSSPYTFQESLQNATASLKFSQTATGLSPSARYAAGHPADHLEGTTAIHSFIIYEGDYFDLWHQPDIAWGNEVNDALIDTNLDGDAKWQGGVLAPNGCIYGIPMYSTSVLKIDPSNDTASTFGFIPPDNIQKWYGCILAPNNGCIYGIPIEHPNVIKIDPSDDSISFLSEEYEGTNKWTGGAVANNGMIYCVPRNHEKILKINPFNDTSELLEDEFPGTLKWWGAVLAPNGMIYGIPRNSDYILKINPNDDSTDLIDLGETDYGAVAARWAGGILALNGIIYCIPFSAEVILKIDPRDDSISHFGELPGANKWLGGSLTPNGIIYCMPYNIDTVLRIDPTNDTVNEVGEFMDHSHFVGGILAPNGCIYSIPRNVPYFAKVGSHFETQLDFCLSRYYNKF